MFDHEIDVMSFIKYNGSKCDYFGQVNKELERHGFGRTCWYDGQVQEGYYVHNKLNGYGRAISDDGDFYAGDWKDFIKHG